MIGLATVLQFLKELREKKIYYCLEQSRDDALMVRIDVPGQRWEVEFLADGGIEVEIFGRSSGVSSTSVEDLLSKLKPYSD
jgi:hypothetical protein